MLKSLFTLMVGLLIFKVTVTVMTNYPDYFPPNFESDFLLGRDKYFFGAYQWAFYPHLVSGPVSLFLGLILLSDRFRMRFPRWHRFLGRIQVACVLLVLAPSGLWMSLHAASGAIAGLGFAALSIATGFTVAMGWRTAVKRRFIEHRRWMRRCFLLLCSAVVVRIVGGMALVTAFDADWVYPLTAWASWLLPLAIYELVAWQKSRSRRRSNQPVLAAQAS